MYKPPHALGHGPLKSYVLGFVLSLVLTLIPYFAVTHHWLAGWPLLATLIGFTFVQVVVQLLLFLNLGREARPRWNLIVFLFMALVVAILFLGSLWIMHHLNYNMMPPMDNVKDLLQTY